MFPTAIEIAMFDGGKHYFTSFSNRNSAYKCLTAIWRNVSPHADPSANTDSEADQSEEQPQTILEERKPSIVSAVSEERKSAEFGAGESDDKDSIQEKAALSKEELLKRSGSMGEAQTEKILEEVKQVDMVEEFEFNLDRKYDRKSSNIVSKQMLLGAKAAEDIKQRKTTKVARDHASSASGSQDEGPNPSEQELKDTIDTAFPAAAEDKKVNEFIIPISPNQFHKLFLEDGAKYSFENYFAERGEKDIVCTPWEDNKREINMVVAIKGVPFCSSSKTTKTQEITSNDNGYCLTNYNRTW